MLRCVESRNRAAALTLLLAGVAIAVRPAPVAAYGNDNKVFIEWFESSWGTIEYRMPDLFMSGYGAVWLPPPSLASTGSPGYDVFDRFNLGKPGAETMYGTESRFRAVLSELKLADADIYVDTVLNHNSARTSNSAFLADGGWPGFYLPGTGTNFWGDFHNGLTQSTNPGNANYDLYTGDLVSLIDIAQESNFQFIRHPIGADARNLPPGNVRNRPDATNKRFYPDRNLSPSTFTNPLPRGDGSTWTVYPFNTADPMQGDPVPENATGLLTRYCQWMLDEFKVDGFRLDAAKHIPTWFWNNYFDPTIFNRRQKPDGSFTTPYSFGESVESNAFVQNYIRKDGFANRDALDLNEAGQLRDIRSQAGFGSWLNVLNASIDTQDNGANDGTQGVHHIYSHDNGSTGNGSSPPSLPTPSLYAMPENAYLLFRPGGAIVYFNGREMHTRFSNRGFWPREGNPTALGDLDQNLVRLVRLHSGYARGNFYVLNSTDPQNTSLNDVLVFERSNQIAANILVGVNDRYDAGYQQRSVQTSFPPGTRLRELTGAATDSTINAGGAIPQVLTVDASRRVLLTVPNNTNINNVQHHRGYVVYGPAAPSGTLSIVPIGGTTGTIPADPATVPSYLRRNTPMTVVTTAQFEVRLDTVKTDPADSNWDDFAVFRFNRGFVDLNGNGSYDQPITATVDAGYERFLTQSIPIDGPGGTGTVGVYRQVINTSALPEGPNYLSVIAYRRRTDGGLPICTEFRAVVYVDRSPPSVQLLDSQAPISNGNFEFRVQANDRTTNAVYILPNLAVGVDPVPLCNTTNQAYQYDRFEFRRNVGTLPSGNNSLTVVAFELSGNVSVQRYENVQVLIGSGDVNGDGLVTIDDFYSLLLIANGTLNTNPAYVAAGDMNRNGQIDAADKNVMENQTMRFGELARMRNSQR